MTLGFTTGSSYAFLPRLVALAVDRRGVELECVMREPLVLAAPEGHPFTVGDAPGLRDLDRAPFIMYAPTDARYFYDLTSSLFRAAEILPSYGVLAVFGDHAAVATWGG